MKQKYSIGDFSKKTSTTIRTLHYYDQIELLTPSFVTENGRRYYSDCDIIELQKIVSLKYLGFSLDEIKQFLQSNKWNLQESLSYQKDEMLKKKQQLEKIIYTLDHALHVIDNKKDIDPAIFTSLINSIQKEDEHKEWFKSVFDEERVNELYDISDEKQKEYEKAYYKISNDLKRLYGSAPNDEKVQKLVKEYISLAEEISNSSLQSLIEVFPEDIDDDQWLFASPFTKEEEEWLSIAFGVHLKSIGVDFDGE